MSAEKMRRRFCTTRVLEFLITDRSNNRESQRILDQWQKSSFRKSRWNFRALRSAKMILDQGRDGKLYMR